MEFNSVKSKRERDLLSNFPVPPPGVRIQRVTVGRNASFRGKIALFGHDCATRKPGTDGDRGQEPGTDGTFPILLNSSLIRIDLPIDKQYFPIYNGPCIVENSSNIAPRSESRTEF